MRKKCLLFLLCMMTTVVAFAGKESLYTFYEGFEEGIPATWMQEYNSGQVSWVVEQSGASLYPAAAMEGNNYVALRNTTGQTQYFTTMLVSPVIDLTEVFQPILVFSHAQLQYAGDVDALRVYYRTSEQSRWVEIGQYTNKTKGWKNDTIVLTAPSATYQIAFEGMDQMGRGIALDEVILRPTPTCDDPSNISADGLTANTATLRWNGSLDTDSFNVVLTTSKQTDPTNPTDIARNEFVANFQWDAKNLERNTLYYVYLQAYCGNTTSEWVEYSFKTKNLSTVPYFMDFNKKYAQGTVLHADYWTHGTSLLDANGNMAFMPYIHVGAKENNWVYYSYNSTTALVFAGACENDPHDDVPVPAGHYVYASTPELDVQNLASLKVSFWGGCHNYVGEEYMSGIIVGAMTDPADFTTFVPVDTVFALKYRGHDRFSVTFDSYKGEGKYIAFASNFKEKDNVFYLDDVKVEIDSELKDITEPVVTNCRGARFDINADFKGNSQIQLIVARDTTDIKTGSIFFDPTLLPADYVLFNKTLSASDFPYTVELEKGGQLVQVYMRATDGSNYGNFSLPYKVLVPMKFTNDVLVDFEDEKGSPNVWSPIKATNFLNTGNDFPFPFTVVSTAQNFTSVIPYYPYVQQSTGYGYNSSRGRVEMGKEIQIESNTGELLYAQKYGDYLALPEVENMSGVYMSFYMFGRSSANVSRVAVGAMTDPFDPTTFDTIAIFEEPNAEWTQFVATFFDYKGKGTFPAIMVVDAANREKGSGGSSGGISYQNYDLSVQYLDDILLAKVPECMLPTNIVAVASDKDIKITWNANGMTQWLVNLYADAAATQKVDSAIATTNTYTFANLDQHTTYYYSVAAKCNDELTDAIVYEIKTECALAESVPYIEDFESWEGGVMNTLTEPLCWTMPRYATSSGSYPYVNASGVNSHEGKASLELYISSTAKPTQDMYAALPMMDAEIQKLQVKFFAKPRGVTYLGDTVFVGLMSDPNDITTFDTVAACKLASTSYIDYIVRFDTYQGNGKHIAFMRPLAKITNTIDIDDIMVDYLSDCEKVQAVTSRNASTTGADIYWQKASATKWEVLLTTKQMTLGSTVKIDSTDVIALETATTMPYRLTSCPTPNKSYYVYVRAVCGDDNKGEWSHPTSFKTTCEPITPENLGLVDFAETNELDCWTVGMREGATNTNLPKRDNNGYLYMFNTATTDGAYAIMPPLDIDSIKDYQVTFLAHGGNNAAYLRELTVGVISNPSDISTFTKIKTISVNKVSANTAATGYGFNEAAQYTVRFDGYKGDYNGDFGKQIMFISESGDKQNYLYIKNIRIDTIAACMELLDVELLEANTNDLTIGWENLGDKYQLQLLDEKQTTIIADTIVTNANSVKIAGLEMLTTYYAKVRQICGENETSVWSYPIMVKTVCPAVYPIPYSEDFEDYNSGAGNLPNCWDGFTNSTTAYPYVYSSAKKDGARGLYFYRTASYYSYAVLPRFELKASELMLSFYYRNVNTSSTTSKLIVGVATDVTSVEGIDSTLTIIDEMDIVPFKAPNNEWIYYSSSMADFEGQDGNIVLIAPKGSSANVYVDNIYVEKAPTCFRPIDLQVLKATTSSVTLSWTPMGKETAWDIAYVAEGGKIEDATIVTVNSNNTVLPSLPHSTSYDFYVRANCGNGDASSWSDPATANTLYLVDVKDAAWNFDNYATQYPSPLSATTRLEKGWMVGNTKNAAVGNIPSNLKNTYNTTGAKTINNHYAKSDSCALKIGATTAANNGAYAIMPEINADYDTLQVRFAGRAISAVGSKIANEDSLYTLTNVGSTYQHSIKIGTLTDPYDITTFELLTDYTFQTVENAKPIVEGGYWEDVVVSLYGAKGKYIAFVSDYNAPNIVYIDDVIVEKVNPCIAPPNFVTMDDDALAADRATFSWVSNADKWQVKITEVETGTIVDEATLTERTWTTTKLQPVVEYTFAVRTTCDDNASAWKTYDLKTPCVPVAMPEDFVVDFESNLYDIEFSQKLPECWAYGALVGTDNATYVPQVEYNTTAYQYSRNVETDNTKAAALHFYNGKSSPTDHYVILPEMNFSMDTLALHFWARAAYFYPATHKNANKLYAKNNAYQRSIYIGTVADVKDMSTFVPLDTFTYSQVFTEQVTLSEDETGNDFWEEVLIPLKEYQGKGRIMILYPNNQAASHFCIDDMDLVPLDLCYPAANLRVTDLTATSATLNWLVTGNDSVRLQVATDEQFSEKSMLVNTVLVNAAGKYQMNNLRAATNYFFRVQHFCSEQETADWTTSQFMTLYGVRFNEQFTEVVTWPVNWLRGNTLPEDVFAGQPMHYNDETVPAGWRRTPSCAFAPNAIRTTTSSSLTNTVNHWLITPVIDLATADSKQQLMLSFQMGLSGNGGAEQLPNTPGLGDKFFVAVSEDGGNTWKKENTTWWSDDTEDNAAFSYAAIPLEGKMYNVDLSQYKGKQVKLAFVNYSVNTNSDNYIYLANITINNAVLETYAAATCQWCDYEDANFFIDANDLRVAETSTYTKYEQAQKDGVSDKLITMNLTVQAAANAIYQATICEGETYEQYNFTIQKATKSAVYKQKLTGVNACDSVVELNLTVLPKLRTTVEQTICQGDYYEFNGVKYYTSTIQSDTLTSQVTGCDSIVTLYLTVNAIIEGTVEEHLCQGESVEFGKFGTITEAGTYVDTIKNALGCDSAATLNVFVHAPVATTVRGAICEGESYTQDVWNGLTQAGDYPSEQETIWGCDSIVTLHLMVADANKTIYDNITSADLPYVLNGEELLPVGTTDGTYTKLIDLSCGTITAVITVGKVTDVNSVYQNSLALAPNLVTVGQETNVYGSFDEDAVLEVYHTTGALVYRSANTNVVPGLPTAGVYMVTVKSNNQVFQSMLIVQ